MTIKEAIKKSGTSTLFSDKVIKAAEKKLQNGEKITYALITTVLSERVYGVLHPEDTSLKNSLKNKIAGVLVITSSRIFFCGGLIFKEILISDIKSVDSAKTLYRNAQIRIQSTTEMIIFDVCVKRLTEIEQVISNARSTLNSQTEVPDNSKYDELCELKKLLDSGVITQEDFDKKKIQLLGI